MNNLFIEPSKSTPEIRLDCETHIIDIRGDSFPEDTADFYEPVICWLSQYLDRLRDEQVNVNIDLVYFNSSSSKVLIDIFDMLEEACEKGKRIALNWFYDSKNELSFEYGVEFQMDFSSMKMTLIKKRD